jgi:DtxR family transcriptional regulator, Mn-dependent transcriptional regulator
MVSLTIENYIKAIYLLTVGKSPPLATTGKLAEALSVLPGTVTSMLKTLSEAGLVKYIPYEGVVLTEAGLSLAVRVVRRHRLMELFLSRTLSLKWDEVHEEAEHLEHAVSDWLVDKIDAFLGFPAADPHGDPIPRADGTISQFEPIVLANIQPNTSFRLLRVLDQTPEFLRYLSDAGLSLGIVGTVTQNRSESGILSFCIGEHAMTLSHAVATKLCVETVLGQ